MSYDDELDGAVRAVGEALRQLIRVGERFGRHMRDEEARIKRRLNRLDAREERIELLATKLKDRAKELYAGADAKGLTEEERYRLIGEANGLEKARRAIEETNL